MLFSQIEAEDDTIYGTCHVTQKHEEYYVVLFSLFFSFKCLWIHY